jgi:hypothetical protein
MVEVFLLLGIAVLVEMTNLNFLPGVGVFIFHRRAVWIYFHRPHSDVRSD